MWYKVNFRVLAAMLLPPVLRSKFLTAFLYVLIVPLRYIYDNFMHLKSSTDDYLDISGHVVYLEKVLNDALCPENRKIYLDTMDPRDSILLYYKEAGKATYMYKKTESKSLLLYHKGEGYNEPSIIIKVPTFLCTSLNNDEDDYNGENLSKIRTIMNIYKPAGRKYSIELYSIQL